MEENKSQEPQDEEKESGKGSQDRPQDRPWWSETVKEMTLTGLATIFMTEESVRNYLKEKKLPKELVSLVLDSITKRKDDFYGLLAKEVGRVFSKVDIANELSKFLETHDVTLNVSFKRKKGE